jgi:hypothetical protein
MLIPNIVDTCTIWISKLIYLKIIFDIENSQSNQESINDK